jgi:hypothetical protein
VPIIPYTNTTHTRLITLSSCLASRAGRTVSDTRLEVYTRRNSHRHTWDFFQVMLSLAVTVSDTRSRTSFWIIDERPKIDGAGPNGGLGHSWGMSPGSTRQFLDQGHPTGRVPSVTRTGDSGGVVMGRNPLIALHVNCPQRHRISCISCMVLFVFMVAERTPPPTPVGAAAASGISPNTAIGSRHCITGCVSPGDMQRCPRLSR